MIANRPPDPHNGPLDHSDQAARPHLTARHAHQAPYSLMHCMGGVYLPSSNTWVMRLAHLPQMKCICWTNGRTGLIRTTVPWIVTKCPAGTQKGGGHTCRSQGSVRGARSNQAPVCAALLALAASASAWQSRPILARRAVEEPGASTSPSGTRSSLLHARLACQPCQRFYPDPHM